MSHPIDFDTEAVHLDGTWYTRDELAQKIRMMLDNGDFAVSRPSQALEELNQAMASLRTLAFRVTPDMAEAVNAAATQQGRTAAAVIRDALSRYLATEEAADSEPVDLGPPRDTGYPSTMAGPEMQDSLPIGQRITMEIPIQDAPVIAGPGALAAAAARSPTVLVDSEALGAMPSESTMELTPTSPKEEEDAIERRWFGS